MDLRGANENVRRGAYLSPATRSESPEIRTTLAQIEKNDLSERSLYLRGVGGSEEKGGGRPALAEDLDGIEEGG